jgi:phage gpG-like protein
MPRIRFTFLGEPQVDRRLEGFADRAQDMTKAWEAIRERYRDYEEQWFASEGNGEWSPLSPRYAKEKARRYPGKPILQREGELLESVTKPDIDVIEPSYAIFGTSDPVAGYHQRGEGRLPVRRVIDIDETERVEWAKIVQRVLVEEDHV